MIAALSPCESWALVILAVVVSLVVGWLGAVIFMDGDAEDLWQDP